jgi:hypothetical protein
MRRARLKPFTSRVHWHWRTPKHFYDELNREWKFNLDPCPLRSRRDGTSISWRGKRVFCNPPYGPRIPAFLAKWHEPEVAVYLLPSRTGTAWFQDTVLPHATEVRFIRDRLTYNDGKGRAPFPSILAIFDNRGGERREA